MTLRAAAAAVRVVPQLDERTVDRVFAVLAGWLMTGVFLDAWAHISGLPDSFWTPWHGVLYSGLASCGLFLVAARYAHRGARPILVAGYDLSLVGFAIGALGGIADAIWHTVFGVEFDIEAAVSPSHLMIAAGILLVVTGPLRAAWDRRSFGLPAALGTVYGLSIITVLVDYANPFADAFGAKGSPSLTNVGRIDQTSALFAFVVYAALLSGFLVLLLRRVEIAAPWLGAIAGLNMAAMVWVNGPLHAYALGTLFSVALASAVLIALAATWLRPSRSRPSELRAFAFLVPALPYAAYAIAIALAFGTVWTPTFWGGLIAMGGLAGLLISALAIER